MVDSNSISKQYKDSVSNNITPIRDDLSIISESISHASLKSIKLRDNKLKEKIPKSNISEEDKTKLFEEWGLEKPEAKKAFEFKLEKDYQRQKKKIDKKLTADDRYQLFLKNNKLKK